MWPLSNGTRSKQFIKLLPSPDGSRESMVQRVVRQLKECGLDGTITVATSVSQRDVIINSWEMEYRWLRNRNGGILFQR